MTVVLLLTALTQIGGLAWLGALWFRRSVPAFLMIYFALAVITSQLAPLAGRVAIPCRADGPLQVLSLFYCATNRTYVEPELRDVAMDLAAHMEAMHPGTRTMVLDANFPFVEGFPLLPHLSHNNGRTIDIAFWYEQNGVYFPGAARSPFGYFAFEPGPSDCRSAFPTLRWDLGLLQPLWHNYQLDRGRMQTALKWLAQDPRVGKVFLEPHLQKDLGVEDPKLRFQGCRAARHDDHIHFQL